MCVCKENGEQAQKSTCTQKNTQADKQKKKKLDTDAVASL